MALGKKLTKMLDTRQFITQPEAAAIAVKETASEAAQIQQSLKAFDHLKKAGELPSEKISADDFVRFVDNVFSNDPNIYKHEPNAVYLADLNSNLAQKLNLNGAKVYLLRGDLHHSRQVKKGGYNQDIPAPIFKELPKLIENAREVIVDKSHGNFFIYKDINGTGEIAVFTLNKDRLGNFVLHTKRADKKSYLAQADFEKVSATGLAPATSTLTAKRSGVAPTTLEASTDTSGGILPAKNLTQLENNLDSLIAQKDALDTKIRANQAEIMNVEDSPIKIDFENVEGFLPFRYLYDKAQDGNALARGHEPQRKRAQIRIWRGLAFVCVVCG